MKVKLSYELKLKLLEEGKKDYFKFDSSNCKSACNVQFIVDLKNNKKLYRECEKWNRQIQTYFKSAYKALKTNIGPFEGLWPINVYNGIVEFRADWYDSRLESWKDWFIVEEDIKDPPQFIQEEIN
jgi:hypothetical protein